MARRKTEPDLDAFHAKLDELKLSFFREHYADVVQCAAQSQWDHLSVLEQLVDRLLHHAETVTLEGRSFRMKDVIEK